MAFISYRYLLLQLIKATVLAESFGFSLWTFYALRHMSGKCCTLLSSIIYFFFKFQLSRFSSYINNSENNEIKLTVNILSAWNKFRIIFKYYHKKLFWNNIASCNKWMVKRTRHCESSIHLSFLSVEYNFTGLFTIYDPCICNLAYFILYFI